jgi:hypothetical protein
MKYLNSLIFLGLMVFVAGCQKKDQPQPKKNAHKVVAKDAKVKKQGPTKLETKKSAAKKAEPVKKHDAKKVADKKQDAKKAAPKKDMKKSNQKSM